MICMSVFSFKEKVTWHHHVLVMKEGSQCFGPSQHFFNLLKKPLYLNPLSRGEKHITSQVFKSILWQKSHLNFNGGVVDLLTEINLWFWFTGYSDYWQFKGI